MVRRVLRGLAVMLPAALAAWAATAAPQRPAEEPPEDFAGRQYIDSTGCVFLREGRQWLPRLSHDGAPVCGYPPTPITRADPPARLPGTAPVPLEGMDQAEAELVATIAAHARPGDWNGSGPAAGDRRPDAMPRPSTPEGGADLARVMAAAVAASPAMARAAADGAGAVSKPNPRLCALLGMGGADTAPVLGGDPTGGFCSDLVLPALSPRVARAEGAATKADAAVTGASAAARSPNREVAKVPEARRIAGRGARPAPATPAVGRVHRPSAPASPDGLIPAGTRFLQVGAYPDAAAAEAALRRVAALGLPVARSRGAGERGRRAIMAGPFGTREAVVRAHDRLTRAGFRGLVPRR